MSQPFVGEIRMFAGNFAPVGWMLCAGQLLPIIENETLFNLIGTTYGGDGQVTFALPDLRGRVPVHMGSGGGGQYVISQTGGQESVNLLVQQLPPHSHAVGCNSADGTLNSPSNGFSAGSAQNQYASQVPDSTMSLAAVRATGGSQPHENMMPFLAVNYIISMFGIFPSQ